MGGVPVLPAASLEQLSSVACPPAHNLRLWRLFVLWRLRAGLLRLVATVVPFARHSLTTAALIRAVSFVIIVGIAITGEQA